MRFEADKCLYVYTCIRLGNIIVVIDSVQTLWILFLCSVVRREKAHTYSLFNES